MKYEKVNKIVAKKTAIKKIDRFLFGLLNLIFLDISLEIIIKIANDHK